MRKAVAARDLNAVAAMMTTDFAYVMGSSPEADRKGEGVFQYWDENGLWPELEGILSETFVKKDEFMVAPPQFANPALEYNGYRAGIRRVSGSWKFAYFVNGYGWSAITDSDADVSKLQYCALDRFSASRIGRLLFSSATSSPWIRAFRRNAGRFSTRAIRCSPGIFREIRSSLV